MLRFLLVFFLGTLSATTCVIATGAHAGGLVLLGFFTATVFYGLLAFLLARWQAFRSWISIDPEKSQPRRESCRDIQSSQVERQVVSALVHQGATRNVARKAVAEAALLGPREFEPLFRAAVGLLHAR
jgi:hypothetical protein